jgi:hypothetical protein
LVEAVTEAITASRFFLEWALTSFSEARDFSTASLNATLPAVVNCSTVFLTVSAAMYGLLGRDWAAAPQRKRGRG